MSTQVAEALHPGETDDPSVALRALVALTATTEVDLGMAEVVRMLRRASGASRVEWWTATGEVALRPAAADGTARGRRDQFDVPGAGHAVVFGDPGDLDWNEVFAVIAPVLRRGCIEEELLLATTRLARRNEALEDFAALVAHELKTPLQAALVADDPSCPIEQALDLVDSLLESARAERPSSPAEAAACLGSAIRDLGPLEIEVSGDLTTTFPLPCAPLRVILRNLLRNAVAAGARHVHVAAAQSRGSWQLVVEDDGVGLDGVESYASGTGIGLSLCRRIASRYGGALELNPRLPGGTRATLVVAEAR